MFNIHNDREETLVAYLYEECNLCSFTLDFKGEINRINGIISSLYMLDIIEEPMIIENYYEVIELKESIKKYAFKI